MVIKDKNVHFIGIGGISMSSLALILKDLGNIVSGSDINNNENVKKLQNCEISVSIGHKKGNISKKIDIIVYTSAISEDNVELKKAKELNIKLLKRSELLGFIMKNFYKSIAVSGTHGKTTTSSILSHIFLKMNLSPTLSLGGNIDIIAGNTYLGKSDYFITEACEYKNNFLNFNPYASIILNIDADHLDFFKDLDDIKKSFTRFSDNTSNILVVNAKDKLLFNHKNMYTFGISDADFIAKDIYYYNSTCHFKMFFKDEFICDVSTPLLGEFNVLNTLSALSLCCVLGIDIDLASNTLKTFKNAKRRLEYKGVYKNAPVYDDYAHHPTEISKTLATLKTVFKKRLTCVFQPHTFSRTKELLNEFSTSFDDADTIIITKIYGAREKFTDEISSEMLVDLIKKRNKNVLYMESFDDIVNYLKTLTSNENLVVTMGATDIYKAGESIINMI